MTIDVSLFTQLDALEGTIPGYPVVERRLSQLSGLFADTEAYEAALENGSDPLIYTVASVAPVNGEGQLHYGLGKILPGRIGDEYYMTRGHFHEWRVAAEVYVGLRGTGLMLLEDEVGKTVRALGLVPNSVVYVPGYAAHRTVNTGDEPLIYLGIYPAQAGHDYGALAERNFRQVVVAHSGAPILLERESFLSTLTQQQQRSK